MDFRNVDGPTEMLESEEAQLYSVSYLLTEAGVNAAKVKIRQLRLDDVAAGKGPGFVNAFVVALLVCGTAICCVALGVIGAYSILTGLLAACNPAKPRSAIAPALVPRESHVSGD